MGMVAAGRAVEGMYMAGAPGMGIGMKGTGVKCWNLETKDAALA